MGHWGPREIPMIILSDMAIDGAKLVHIHFQDTAPEAVAATCAILGGPYSVPCYTPSANVWIVPGTVDVEHWQGVDGHTLAIACGEMCRDGSFERYSQSWGA